MYRNQTGGFPSLICRVWKIFSINNPVKDNRFDDQDSSPLMLNDSRFQLISTIVRWLEHWRSLPYTQGKLTVQTFASFRHSCIAQPRLDNYLTGD